MTNVPEKWAIVPIVAVLSPNDNGKPFQQGSSPQCENYSAEEGRWGVLKTTAIQPGVFLDHENKQLPNSIEARTNIEVRPGDLLMTCAGPRSRCGIVCLVERTRQKLMMSGKMYRFRPNPALMNERYLMYFIQSRAAQVSIDSMKTGISDSGLNLTHDRFSGLQVPLAPMTEQNRIVCKIQELFSELDKVKESLTTAQQQLKAYRQAVLRSAFEGKLTVDWRPENKHLIQTRQSLFERIRTTRQEGYRLAAEVHEASGQTSRVLRPLKPISKDHPTPPDLSLPSLPGGWHWAPLQWLLSVARKPMTTGPFGTALKKEEHQPFGVPVLGIENIGRGMFVPGNKIFVTAMKALELSSFEVDADDIIISRAGTVGEICAVPAGLGKALMSTNLLRIALNPSVIVSAFFVYLFQGGGSVKSQVRALCKGSSREFLNQSILGSIAFPLCSLEEQHEVVRRLARISHKLSASRRRISESCCAATSFERFAERPDADRV